MEIGHRGAPPSNDGPTVWFPGAGWIDPLSDVPDPARVAGAGVISAPGAPLQA